jgi:hypothetical protein
MTLRSPGSPVSHLNEQSWRAAAAYLREEAALVAPLEQEWARQRVQSQARASALWRSSRPIAGTVAERYLARHGICLPVPSTVRFHPSLEDYPDSRPGLLALVTAGDGAPIDVQRTFLRPDGTDKAAVEFPTSTLGWWRWPGTIRLGEPGDALLLGTSLEDCLLAQQETGIPAWVLPTKYAAPGFIHPSGLPPRLRDVVLLDDNEETGSSCPKARARAYAGLEALGWRLRQEGRRVRILHSLRGVESCGCSHPHPVTDAVH